MPTVHRLRLRLTPPRPPPPPRPPLGPPQVEAALAAAGHGGPRVALHLRRPGEDLATYRFGHLYEETPVMAAHYIHADGVAVDWPRVALALVDGSPSPFDRRLAAAFLAAVFQPLFFGRC
jgi:hypothetical protein